MSEWISVIDRLPDLCQRVLVHMLDDNSEVGGDRLTNFDVWIYEPENPWWGGSDIAHRITHWMPLPDPPKEHHGE